MFSLSHLIVVSASFLFANAASAVTLTEAVQAALQKNEGARQARERVVQSEEQFSQAKGSIYPNVSLNATHLIQEELKDPAARQLSPAQQTTTNLALKQPLFRGFREFAGVRQRGDHLEAQKQDRTAALLNLYAEIAASYLDVLALEQDLKNLNEQQTLTGQRVNELQVRIRRGESSPTESLTAQSTAAALEAEVQLVQMRLSAARENFTFLTSLPSDSVLKDSELQTLNDPKPKQTLDQYLSRIEERPDVKSAFERWQASEEDVSIAKGGHWPTLDLLGNYYFQRPAGYLENQKWDVMFQFSLPIFEGGVKQSQVREAASKRQVADLELQKLRRQSSMQVRNLYQSLQARTAQLKALKQASELSERNYQTLQRDYRRGLSRNIDVQMALTEYRVSRRTYDQARFTAQLDLIRLEAAAAILPNVLVKEL